MSTLKSSLAIDDNNYDRMSTYVESQNVTHVHCQLKFAGNVTRDFFKYISTQLF